MPSRPPRYVPPRTGPRPRDARPTAAERGYGWDWQQTQKACLADTVRRLYPFGGPLCYPCERAGRVTVAEEVDHIRQKSEGGTDDPANLQSICKDCHNRKKAAENRDRAARRSGG